MNYTLYLATYCPYCKKVLRFMEENKIEDVEILYTDKDAEAKKALLDGGGKQQVPCLQFDDQWMYESDDIIRYMKEHLL